MPRSNRPARRLRSSTRAASIAGAFAGAIAGAMLLVPAPKAHACGCLAPPDPTVPAVQAGERILFAVEDGTVTAHIQIQYAGAPGEFGWLLPVPSLPRLELGSDEVFSRLLAATQPVYRLMRTALGTCPFPLGPPGRVSGGTIGGAMSDPAPDPVVVESTIGPYDYAVLRADSREEMLRWMADNRYFVPAGTTDVVGPYIRPGAYFLALKLRSGESTGDLQPVVVRYQADLPMIPLVLTSVAAQPDMAVQIWVAGQARAIPRNYFHVILNDVHIDWLGSGSNYAGVVARAVREAPDHHAFVTEYAGRDLGPRVATQLASPGRFGSESALAAASDVFAFVDSLRRTGFTFDAHLFAVLAGYIPVPPALAGKVPASEFYGRLAYYLGDYRAAHPEDFEGWPGVDYRPADMAREIHERIVAPIVAAADLVRRSPYLTRLLTVLSPEDMTRDPVFSFNADLGDFSLRHTGTLIFDCRFPGGDSASTTPATLLTEQGSIVKFPDGLGARAVPPAGAPYARRIEILGESGPPSVVPPAPSPGPGGSRTSHAGCACALDRSGSGLTESPLGWLAALSVLGLRRLRTSPARATRPGRDRRHDTPVSRGR